MRWSWHRRDRQAWIHTGIGRDDRTIADKEVLVAEHPMLAIDNSVLGGVGRFRAGEDPASQWLERGQGLIMQNKC
jgi:hypothetical protein